VDPASLVGVKPTLQVAVDPTSLVEVKPALLVAVDLDWLQLWWLGGWYFTGCRGSQFAMNWQEAVDLT